MTELADDSPIVCAAQDECEHADTRVAIEPPGSLHFAREVCLNCDRVLRWLPKPRTIERRRLHAFTLTKLAMNNLLSPWERSFVQSLLGHRKLSPKQEAILERLAKQYLGERTSR